MPAHDDSNSPAQPVTRPLPPYGTGIRHAVATYNAEELKGHIGTIEVSLAELAKSDAQALAKMASSQLSEEQIKKLTSSLKALREVLGL